MTGHFQTVIFELRFKRNLPKSEEDYNVRSGGVARFNITLIKLTIRT
jgi:hypothetical protein